MNVVELKLSEINQVTENHRSKDSEQDVAELMASIKKAGLINPVTVKKKGKKYILIAGFRRLLATKKLKLQTISANIIDTDLSDTAINLVENLQRENTSSYEIGRGIHRMMTSDKLSEGEISVLLGISKSVTKTYLNLFKETPVKYRNKVRNVGATGGKVKKGVIPNATAHTIILMQKAGKINAKERNELFDQALKGKTLSEIRTLNKGTITKDQKTVSMQIGIQLSIAHKKKMGTNPHKKIRTLIEKEFGVKVLNK